MFLKKKHLKKIKPLNVFFTPTRACNSLKHFDVADVTFHLKKLIYVYFTEWSETINLYVFWHDVAWVILYYRANLHRYIYVYISATDGHCYNLRKQIPPGQYTGSIISVINSLSCNNMLFSSLSLAISASLTQTRHIDLKLSTHLLSFVFQWDFVPPKVVVHVRLVAVVRRLQLHMAQSDLSYSK